MTRPYPKRDIAPVRQRNYYGHVKKAKADHRLAELERQGLVRRGRGGLPKLLRRQPIRVKGSVLRDLLAERRSGL